MKKYLHIILLGMLMMGTPLAAFAEEMCEEPESEITSTTITVKGFKARVCGANGEVLYVYDLSGVVVCSFAIDSADKTVDLNVKKGCYILRVGKIARKFSIR